MRLQDGEIVFNRVEREACGMDSFPLSGIGKALEDLRARRTLLYAAATYTPDLTSGHDTFNQGLVVDGVIRQISAIDFLPPSSHIATVLHLDDYYTEEVVVRYHDTGGQGDQENQLAS